MDGRELEKNSPQDSQESSGQVKHKPVEAVPVAPLSGGEHIEQAPTVSQLPPVQVDSDLATPETVPPHSSSIKRAVIAFVMILLVGGLAYLGWPILRTTLNTVSTDDAYVNGHVTFVAARVPGQVSEVLVDDNNRVKKGDVLVRLDPEPYRVQVDIKQAAVDVAKANLAEANAQVRALVGQTRANRYSLEYAIEQVNEQIVQLKADVATLNSRKAELDLAKSNLARGEELAPSGGISKEDLDIRRHAVEVDEARVQEAIETIYAARAKLGLPNKPPHGQELSEVPPNLDQNFATVRQALANLIQSAAQIGYYPESYSATPKQVVADFYKQDPRGDLDEIYAKLIPNAPLIKQAEAQLEQAKSDLEQARLNLQYCDVVSEIDGVVTRRNVNPGNNIQAGQSLMAVRSLKEIWIDANFKETQLGYLRIGQPVRCEVDMYGNRHEFEGRISGFTMGTGETLALLPPQNATGNFVKIVQRLPVRIEVLDYDPDKLPLFVGLSVEPRVYFKEPATGPHAGEYLQPDLPLPQKPVEPKP